LNTKPFIIAHRGARSIAPENTIAAANQAFEIGADLWETDIVVTRDEQLILFHDDSLQRTTNVATVFPKRQHQVFTQFTLAEIRLLDLGSHFIEHDPFGEINKGSVSPETLASFKAEKVPTLEEALVFTKEKHWKVNLELKKLPENFKDFPITQRVIELIRILKIDPAQLIISSFNHSWLRQVEVLEPSIEIQALIGYFESEPLDWGDFSFSTYNALSTRIDEEQIARAKNKGKSINLYTVNEKDEMIRFIKAGVDGLITDYPQRLAAIIKAD
jgi:glycerophosphoryl diester phosphodiesterase